MKKLIAARPIQYMGRTYEAGEVLPAYDGKMVDAWLKAGTAKMETAAERVTIQGQTAPTVNDLAADALRSMGVTIEDDAGAFVGTDNLLEQVRKLAGVTPSAGKGEDKLVEGHLDPKQLATMKKGDLEAMAKRLGVDISGAKNNAERAALIAAVPVQAPADDVGGAQ